VVIARQCPGWGQGNLHGDGNAIGKLEAAMGEEFPQGVRHVSCVTSEILDLGGSLGFHRTGISKQLTSLNQRCLFHNVGSTLFK
jgi:hypothetical protein